MGGALTFFFAALVGTAAVLVALLVLVAVARLVVLGAPVVVALGPRCGEERPNGRRFRKAFVDGGQGGGSLVSRKLDEVTRDRSKRSTTTHDTQVVPYV